MLGALVLVADKTSKQRLDALLKPSDRIAEAAYRNRVLFRAFGDNIPGSARPCAMAQTTSICCSNA